MTFHINDDECKKQGVPISTALAATSLYCGELITPETFEDLCARGYIEYDGFSIKRFPLNPRLTQNGIDIVETLVLNSEFDDSKKINRFDVLASYLREIYPEGKKPGTVYMWRDSVPIISKRLKAFVKKFGDYSNVDIINATKRYVQSFNGDYKYMQLLKYFILKRENNLGEVEENSQLLSYLNNKDTDLNNNWEIELR